MEAIDFSASRCYPVELPKKSAGDPRIRLDCRTGASLALSGSQIIAFAGLPRVIALPAHFTPNDVIDALKDIQPTPLLSAELFALSLVKHKWFHLSAGAEDKPTPRMFAGMAVHGRFAYIGGGIAVQPGSDFHVLNDLWRFDLAERRWECVLHEGNNDILPRYRMKFTYQADLKPTGHGFVVSGGYDAQGRPVEVRARFDTITGRWADGLRGEDAAENNKITVEENMAASVGGRSGNDAGEDPADGTRLPPLDFPTVGHFGENLLVSGFPRNVGANRADSTAPVCPQVAVYIRHESTRQWTQLKTRCMHRGNTHRLCSGFVWGSHHLFVLLGLNRRVRYQCAPACAQFFDMYLFVPLAFSCSFGVDGGTARAGIAGNVQDGSAADSGFLAYANRVAPYLPVSSIPPVFSPPAVALAKNAFQRTDEISDFEFVCADGTSIPVPLTVCRRRWGHKFDTLLSEASAWSFASAYDPEACAGLHRANAAAMLGPAVLDSFSGAYSGGARNPRMRSEHWGTPPQFRTPFGSSEKDHPRNPSASDPGFPRTLRRNSSSVETLGTPHRGSAHSWLAQRRGSIPRTGSFFQRGSIPRRRSLDSTSLRRTSLLVNMAEMRARSQASGDSTGGSEGWASADTSLSSTRRSSGVNVSESGVAMSGSLNAGIISGPVTINSADLPPATAMPGVDPEGRQIGQPAKGELARMGTAQAGTAQGKLAYAGAAQGKPVQVKPAQPVPALSPLTYLTPSHGPAPEVSPSESSGAPLSPSDSTGLSPLTPAPAAFTSAPPTSVSPRPLGSISAPDVPALVAFADAENSIPFPEPREDTLNVGNLPRQLCIPYARPTVVALADYLITGQVGTRWRIFPTVTELLMLAKRYDIPLLYNLVLELLFVILARKRRAVEKAKGSRAGKAPGEKTAEKNLQGENLPGKKLQGENSPGDVSPGEKSGGVPWESDRALLLHASAYSHDPSTPRLLSVSSESLDPGESSDSESSSGEDEGSNVKTTIGFLDPEGYSEESDSGDAQNSACAARASNMGGGIRGGGSTRLWPTLEELVGEDAKPCSETILEMLIEVGALINDMKLMMNAIDIKESCAEERKASV